METQNLTLDIISRNENIANEINSMQIELDKIGLERYPNYNPYKQKKCSLFDFFIANPSLAKFKKGDSFNIADEELIIYDRVVFRNRLVLNFFLKDNPTFLYKLKFTGIER